MANLNPGGAPVVLQNLRDPTTDDEAATKAYVDANSGGGGSDLTAGTSIDITDGVISATLADATNPGTIPALPQDFGTVFTEALKSDGQFYDDGTQWNLSDATIARSANGGTGQKYTAQTGGTGMDVTFDGNHVVIGIASSGVGTTQIATGAVGVNQLATDIPINTLSDVNTAAVTEADNDVLTWDESNTEWRPQRPLVADIRDGGHIGVVSDENNHFTLTFDETYDLWNSKSDWVQINTGMPSLASNEILWNATTETLTVPSLAGREVLEILLSARSGMAVQIRQENSTPDPSGFQSGFYQILDIDATASPEQVILQLLPDASDIFTEEAGGTYTYRLTILQFVTGGTLNNLTLEGLGDTDFSTVPVAGQVLGFNSNGRWVPQDAAAADISGNVIGDLMNVSATAATDNQVLTWNNTDSLWEPADASAGESIDYNNAPYASISDGSISFTYTVATSPVNEGEVSIGTPDSPTTGYTLTFRKADVDVKALQSVNLFQIGFGSPVLFATYAVTTTSINNGVDPALVVMNVATGPLDGTDLLSTLISDGTSLSISVSNNEFEQPDLGDLPDVDFSTAPTDGQVLAYEAATDTWKPATDANGLDLGDLGDVNTNGVADGFLIRYDGPNSNYRAHSVSNTVAVYGGLSSNRSGTLVTPVSSGTNSLAVGNNASATGTNDIAVGIQAAASGNTSVALGADARATAESSLALGELSRSAHVNSTALGTGASTSENNEVRLGDGQAHVTVNSSVAGNESDDNQLVSKRWVNNQISDASRVVSSTANALENLTVVTASTPWDDYRIVPGTALVPELQVHMYEFDATESQFIFYPGFLSDAITGNGADLTTGTIPDFFEEVTNIANEPEVTNAGGTAVTSLGWKYLGHDTATVWQAVSHVYTFNFEWIYPGANSDGAQNPPDVTSSLELVRLKPLSDNTYNMAMNATVIASSPTSFHNAGQLNPGDTESFTGSYEFAQQELADGISNVENGDVFAYRMKIRYKGNGFDGNTNVRLAITESETTNFVPQLGIRHVGRDYSLTVEDSGDVQWTDHGSAIESTLLLIDNSGTEPVIPSASLGLEVGNGLDFTESQLDIQLDGDSSGLALAVGGLSLDADLAELNDVTGTVPTDGQVLTWDDTASLWGPAAAATTLTAGSGIDITSDAISVDLSTNSGLGFNTLDDNSLFVATHIASGLETTVDGLGINLGFGMAIDNSGAQQNELRVVPGDISLGDLGDMTLTTPTDGQIIHYDAANTQWVNTTLAAGTDLTFTLPLTVSAADVVSLNRGSGLFLDSSNSLAVNPGTGISVSAAEGVFLNATIGNLTDVNTTSKAPTEGQYLSYDNTDGEWVPVDAPQGGEDYVDITFTDGDAFPSVGTNTRAIGIGPASTVSAANGIAVGYNATVSSSGATAIGSEATSAGTNATALGQNASTNAGNATALGTDAMAGNAASTAVGHAANAMASQAVAIGNSAGAGGTSSIAIGDDPSTSTSALAIAIGERAQAVNTRAIAIGSSSNSADNNATLCNAGGLQSIAIGRAARSNGTDNIAIGSDAIAGEAFTSATAIGDGATVTVSNSTVLGAGGNHRVFAGTRELATATESNDAGAAITCTIGSTYWAGDNFSPAAQTLGESLKYTAIGNVVIGQFEFELVTSTVFSFKDSDRWTLTSTSTSMTNCFGYASPAYGIALGTFTIAEGATNSAAFGDFYLQPSTTTSSVVLAFRVRSVIGTPPTRDAKVSCQFNLAKL